MVIIAGKVLVDDECDDDACEVAEYCFHGVGVLVIILSSLMARSM